MTAFTELVDLSSERVGGAALLANDEFFAPKENLVKPGEAVFQEHAYTERGKLMDGWESRRKRVPGYDWCVLRLGLPGVIRGVVVDTAHFKGNFPESCSIDACCVGPNQAPEDLLLPSVSWVEILPRTNLAGDSKNAFAIASPWCFTHVRLNIHPDGGVARLRVHGEPHPDWKRVSRGDGELDLAALENGGLVVATSDRFFSAPHNLLMPGLGTFMGDGWETRRRRGPGHDWALIRLGLSGRVGRAVVETTHFKGNYPDGCSLEACAADPAQEARLAAGDASGVSWVEILPRQKLQAHARHEFEAELRAFPDATHVRFNIFPDGGVSRLRLFGTLGEAGRARAGLRFIDSLTPSRAEEELLLCCGSTRWARALAGERPCAEPAVLYARADRIAAELMREDWLEAFARHPRIGERASGASEHARWSEEEQSGARASSGASQAALVAANRAYEARFGWIFIVCASGKTADEMLAILEKRLRNTPEDELRTAAGEQRQIARLRLGKLVGVR